MLKHMLLESSSTTKKLIEDIDQYLRKICKGLTPSRKEQQMFKDSSGDKWYNDKQWAGSKFEQMFDKFMLSPWFVIICALIIVVCGYLIFGIDIKDVKGY